MLNTDKDTLMKLQKDTQILRKRKKERKKDTTDKNTQKGNNDF